MTSVIVASTPVHGHVSPLLITAADLATRGHEVTVLTGARFEDRARATGARFAALPEEADYDDRRLSSWFPGRARLAPGPGQIGFDLTHIFGDPMPAQYAALRLLAARTQATTVISDSHFLGTLALTLGAERGLRPGTIALGVAPPPVYDDQFRAALGEAQVHLQKLFASVGAALPGFVLDSMVAVPDRYLQLTVPGFEYPRDDAPASFRFVGPLPPEPERVSALPDWWPELSDGQPVVVVTQGTFANADLGRLVVPALRALSGARALMVAVTGRTGGAADVRSLMGTVPENARLADYVPFDLLLPHADVLITNGGYGGVHTALRHGVPMVVAGATEDKPKVAARVEWSGTGLDLRSERPGEEALRTAVGIVLDSPRFHARARELRSEFARFDALGTIAGIVEGREALLV